jgi:hypothetical protein
MNELAWQDFKLAGYKERIANAYLRIGKSEEAAIAYSESRKLLNDAYASSDLTPQTRAVGSPF